MTESIEELKAALDLVINSEEVGIECENANYHSLTGFLQEIRNGLHEHKFNGAQFDYDDGSYEVECSHDGCYRCIFVESS